MVMSIPLALKPSYVNAIMIYVIFAAWAALTLSILVLMEGLSAFLHTLRKFELKNESKVWGHVIIKAVKSESSYVSYKMAAPT